MSSISTNYSVNPLITGNDSGVNNTNDAQKTNTDKNLTVTLQVGQNAETGGPIAITLSYPLIGVDDVALNELMQQLESLDVSQFEGFALADIINKVNAQIIKLAGEIETGGEAFFKENREQLVGIFDGLEKMMEKLEHSLYNLVANSNYPDFADFLKDMLLVAQELRKSASDARQAAVTGEFNNTLLEAQTMRDAAQARYDKAMDDVAAKRAQAISQMIGAVVAIGISFAGAKVGGFDGLQSVSGLSNSFSQLSGSIGSLISISHDMSAATNQKKAENLDAQVKELQATAKLLQESQTVASELADIAKQLRDMVLKLYQDFMSSQNQIIQRSNI